MKKDGRDSEHRTHEFTKSDKGEATETSTPSVATNSDQPSSHCKQASQRRDGPAAAATKASLDSRTGDNGERKSSSSTTYKKTSAQLLDQKKRSLEVDGTTASKEKNKVARTQSNTTAGPNLSQASDTDFDAMFADSDDDILSIHNGKGGLHAVATSKSIVTGSTATTATLSGSKAGASTTSNAHMTSASTNPVKGSVTDSHQEENEKDIPRLVASALSGGIFGGSRRSAEGDNTQLAATYDRDKEQREVDAHHANGGRPASSSSERPGSAKKGTTSGISGCPPMDKGHDVPSSGMKASSGQQSKQHSSSASAQSNKAHVNSSFQKSSDSVGQKVPESAPQQAKQQKPVAAQPKHSANDRAAKTARKSITQPKRSKNKHVPGAGDDLESLTKAAVSMSASEKAAKAKQDQSRVAASTQASSGQRAETIAQAGLQMGASTRQAPVNNQTPNMAPASWSRSGDSSYNKDTRAYTGSVRNSNWEVPGFRNMAAGSKDVPVQYSFPTPPSYAAQDGTQGRQSMPSGVSAVSPIQKDASPTPQTNLVQHKGTVSPAATSSTMAHSMVASAGIYNRSQPTSMPSSGWGREDATFQHSGIHPDSVPSWEVAESSKLLRRRLQELPHTVLLHCSHHFLDPLSKRVMTDPVVAEDGHTYERECILYRFACGHDTSRMTGQSLTNTRLYPNTVLRKQIIEWVDSEIRKMKAS
eukprot:gb/GECG01003298.1/.p1 GENE.gb/GECG01003298.1/~~gb/GECG01003298.1/.p1  ORF type:complete len:702 (+),score=95.24 gb/GECG01003298.1/:1-2106(+)